MNDINQDWKPTFGVMYYWLAMDSNGRIARMMNNSWGGIPRVLLIQDNIGEILDNISEYIWEENLVFNEIPHYKNGKSILDLYPAHPFLETRESRKEFIEKMNLNPLLSDESLPARKGIYIYQAIEGNKEGDDYPVGYEGKTTMGDYYRYLMPTVYATIEDFPKELRHGIAVSHTLDFSKDRLIFNHDIDKHFTQTA